MFFRSFSSFRLLDLDCPIYHRSRFLRPDTLYKDMNNFILLLEKAGIAALAGGLTWLGTNSTDFGQYSALIAAASALLLN